MPARRAKMLILAAGLALTVPGCTDATGPIAALKDLAVAQRRWRDFGYSDYRYRLQVSCFCIIEANQQVEITVTTRGTGVFYVATGLPADTAIFARYITMERLFATIAEAANRDGATLTAQYDPALGYPRRASVDPVPAIADDEFSVTVSDVVQLYIR